MALIPYDSSDLKVKIRYKIGDAYTPVTLEDTYLDAIIADFRVTYPSDDAMVYWKATIEALNQLIVLKVGSGAASSGSSTTTRRKEKVGELEIEDYTQTSSSASSGEPLKPYYALLARYQKNPQEFGVDPSVVSSNTSSSTVIIGGVRDSVVEANRNNPDRFDTGAMINRYRRNRRIIGI